MIENLPLLRPDASRSATTMARCHERLAARRRKVEARAHPPSRSTVAAERLLAAGFCVAYLIAMAGNILAVAAGR
jgi:hypothetical protein